MDHHQFKIFIILFCLGFAIIFLWSFIRPSFVRRACHYDAKKQATEKAKISHINYGKEGYKRTDYNGFYGDCLHQNGL